MANPTMILEFLVSSFSLILYFPISVQLPPPPHFSPYNCTCPNTLPKNGREFLWSLRSPSLPPVCLGPVQPAVQVKWSEISSAETPVRQSGAAIQASSGSQSYRRTGGRPVKIQCYWWWKEKPTPIRYGGEAWEGVESACAGKVGGVGPGRTHGGGEQWDRGGLLRSGKIRT